MYQRELDSRNHLLTHTPPTKLERALDLSRNSGQTYSSNPEKSTNCISRTEFENSIQEMKDSMRRLQTYTIRDLENKINILRKETMLKSYIYKNECEIIECPISFFHIGTLHECAE